MPPVQRQLLLRQVLAHSYQVNVTVKSSPRPRLAHFHIPDAFGDMNSFSFRTKLSYCDRCKSRKCPRSSGVNLSKGDRRRLLRHRRLSRFSQDPDSAGLFFSYSSDAAPLSVSTALNLIKCCPFPSDSNGDSSSSGSEGNSDNDGARRVCHFGEVA